AVGWGGGDIRAVEGAERRLERAAAGKGRALVGDVRVAADAAGGGGQIGAARDRRGRVGSLLRHGRLHAEPEQNNEKTRPLGAALAHRSWCRFSVAGPR